MGLNLSTIKNIFSHSSSAGEGITNKGTGFLFDENRCLIAQKTNQTITTNTVTLITFDNVVTNDNKMFDAGSNTIITIQEDGFYSIEAGVGYNNNATSYRWMVVYKTGDVGLCQDAIHVTDGGLNAVMGCSKIVYLKKGDTVYIKTLQNSGGDLATRGLSTQTFLQLMRIGS